MRRAARLAVIGGVAIALAAFSPASWSAAAEGPRIDRAPAAPFRVRAMSGQALSLDALLAKGPVVLDFWATWCQPCTQSLPEMEAVHRRWKERGVTVIGVSIDGPRNQARVRPFAARLGLSFPIVFDADGSLQRDYQVSAVPTTVVIDARGAIVYSSQGWWPGETRAIEKTLAGLFPGQPEAARP